MGIKLFDSELKVMEVLWREGDLPAKKICEILGGVIGWNRNTTYTVIKKCVEKKAIERREPDFVCHALINKDEIQNIEVDNLIDKMFDGSSDLLFSSLIGRKKISGEVLEKLKKIPE